jgi:hypothetical protein
MAAEAESRDLSPSDKGHPVNIEGWIVGKERNYRMPERTQPSTYLWLVVGPGIPPDAVKIVEGGKT